MARTVQECYDYITTNLVTEFAAVGNTRCILQCIEGICANDP